MAAKKALEPPSPKIWAAVAKSRDSLGRRKSPSQPPADIEAKVVIFEKLDGTLKDLNAELRSTAIIADYIADTFVLADKWVAYHVGGTQ
jgi:hypothetical protein